MMDRDDKGRFIKGHRTFPGVERGWFKKGEHASPGTELKKGHSMSVKTRRKISKMMQKIMKGTNNRGNGWHHSEETKRKMAAAQMGNKNHAWRGGKSYENYPQEWSVPLRREIRERDNYTCQLCGKRQGSRALHVHHIDYKKKNCDPQNLITLCAKDNVRVNKNRKYWTKYFKEGGWQ